jgi:hypothetical protein
VFDVAELQPRYTCSKCHSESTIKILNTKEAVNQKQSDLATNGVCPFCRVELEKVEVRLPAVGPALVPALKQAIDAYQTFYRLVVDHNLPIKLVAERQRAGKPEPQEPKG